MDLMGWNPGHPTTQPALGGVVVEFDRVEERSIVASNSLPSILSHCQTIHHNNNSRGSIT